MATSSEKVEGTRELTKKLHTLGDPKEIAAAMRAAVREPMRRVMKQARANIGIVSPGETEIHRTYKGRLVTAGFASRSVRMAVKIDKKAGSAYSIVGVLAEAFYALQFFELGTAKIAARPWLVPAFAASKDASIKGIAEVLKKHVERIAAKRAGGGTNAS